MITPWLPGIGLNLKVWRVFSPFFSQKKKEIRRRRARG